MLCAHQFGRACTALLFLDISTCSTASFEQLNIISEGARFYIVCIITRQAGPGAPLEPSQKLLIIVHLSIGDHANLNRLPRFPTQSRASRLTIRSIGSYNDRINKNRPPITRWYSAIWPRAPAPASLDKIPGKKNFSYSIVNTEEERYSFENLRSVTVICLWKMLQGNTELQTVLRSFYHQMCGGLDKVCMRSRNVWGATAMVR